MSTRRDWLLQQMGITQYQLRRPRALKGEIALTVAPDTRLLIVATVPPALDDALVADVLRALALEPHQVMPLTPDQVAMLPEEGKYASWCLGLSDPLTRAGIQLDSPALDELYYNGAAKRALWRQICEHDGHLLSHPE